MSLPVSGSVQVSVCTDESYKSDISESTVPGAKALSDIYAKSAAALSSYAEKVPWLGCGYFTLTSTSTAESTGLVQSTAVMSEWYCPKW